MLLAALTLPHEDGEGADSYYTRVMKDAFTESNNARDRGLEIHKAMENWWLDIPLHGSTDIESIARRACMKIFDYCGNPDLFTPEQIVVGDGYGGKVDLFNDIFCIDYKTKEISDEDWDKYLEYQTWLLDDNATKERKPPKLAYPEMCMQLAAYDKALGKSWADQKPRRMVNVFVDRNIPGRVIIWEWSNEEAVLAFEKFELLVKYWQLSKNYCPVVVK